MSLEENPIPLSRPYTCIFGTPTLSTVDLRIFHLTHFNDCMKCDFCQDSCCQYGADIEMPRVDTLLANRTKLEKYLGLPSENWFRTDPEDHGILEDAEYPGGTYTRTQVSELPPNRSAHNEYACVFLDPTPGNRGCRLHRFALEESIDYQQLKPMVCCLFPVAFAYGLLGPAYELELEDELVCQGPGATLYRSARSDLGYYFGKELLEELDQIEYQQAQKRNPDRVMIHLPLWSSS